MLKFYFHPSPNPAKVALYLEEVGLDYTLVPVDTRKGEQFTPEFLKINPNAKTPAMTDGDIAIFDSTAILLYLVEKTGQFGPENTLAARAAYLSWMSFIASGIGPYSGQCVHFSHFTPEKIPYAIERYRFEAVRHWKIIDDQLGKHPYMLGNSYGVVDMAVWGWARAVGFILGADAWGSLANVKRLLDEVSARPAAQRAEALKARHPFKAELDADARKLLFKHIKTAD